MHRALSAGRCCPRCRAPGTACRGQTRPRVRGSVLQELIRENRVLSAGLLCISQMLRRNYDEVRVAVLENIGKALRRIVLQGTAIAPMPMMPRKAITICGESLITSATRSPGRIPRAASAPAAARRRLHQLAIGELLAPVVDRDPVRAAGGVLRYVVDYAAFHEKRCANSTREPRS